jgi:hypothetical protein
MSEKLTYRDILVYILNGMISIVLIGFVYRERIYNDFFNKEILNSEFLFFILIPISYLIGHLILSIDNLIFMRLLNKGFREKLINSKCKTPKLINNLIFGYRIVGVKDRKWKKEFGSFELKCADLRNNGKYSHAERSYILSDSFKGLIIIEFIVIILTIQQSDWYYLITSCIILILFYLRAREYSNKYINEIIRQVKLIA